MGTRSESHGVRRRPALSRAATALVLALVPPLVSQDVENKADRVDRLNRAFLDHVRALGSANAIAATTIAEGWERIYRDQLVESFVPDALAVLYPSYRAALEAFDDERPADVLRLLEPLRDHDDPFLVANARYFHVRALVALGRYEEAEVTLASIDERRENLVAHTPYAPHLWFIRAVCQTRNLRFDEAVGSLESLQRYFSDAPEAVRLGAAQLLLEIRRRERGTLGEVATLMDYVADRLHATDAGQRVHQRQRNIVALLDQLIREREQRERQSSGYQQPGGRKAGSPRQAPRKPRPESDAPVGAGQVGDLHEAPRADPGEMWGKLPPAERERILQSIRDRFPSRYKQLVEQYYRALAEQK